MAKVLMQGNIALAEAAVRAGCNCFFGYPITPQTEIIEYLSWRLPEAGGVFLQAESEVSAINMVYGASGAGARVLTSSSGPGISLMAEGISYMAAAELPAVIVNIMRAGPGLGGIQPSQADYFQAVKSAGHGGYRCPVLAPNGVQEMADLTFLAFDLADKYRTPVFILADALIGQMKELAEIPEEIPRPAPKPWATTGRKGRPQNVINSLFLDNQELEDHNRHLWRKYQTVQQEEQRAESFLTEGAEVVIVAFGIVSRVVKEAVIQARKEGILVGMVRPITLWPFPEEALRRACHKAKAVLVTEMSSGQMLEDVKLTISGKVPVHFLGKVGAEPPTTGEVLQTISQMIGGEYYGSSVV